MQITILGSGGWEGIPSPFCKCRVCQQAIQDPKSKDSRTRPEILVEGDGDNFLLELSPDIRLQSTRFDLPVIKDYLVSHWHFDHLYGILELHAWSKFVVEKELNIFCSQKTTEWIEKTFGHIPKNIITLEPYKNFVLHGVNITPIPLYHMQMRDAEIEEDNLNNTFGYILENEGKKIAYLADYYKIPQKAIDLIKGSDVIIADGTYLFEDLFPDKATQNGLKADPDHMHDKAIFSFVESLQAKEVIFHSITHLTEKNHEELQALLPGNFRISFDGMKL
jgi:phosphoribosyl 1,2-cyclic phosphate phosphodiesterase